MSQVVGLDGCAVVAVHPDKVTQVVERAPGEAELAHLTNLFKLLDDAVQLFRG